MYCAVLLVLFAADPSRSGIPTSGDAPQLRPYHELSRDLHEALRDEATAKGPRARAVAIHRLVELYRELRTDPRLADSETLTGYKNQLWARLNRVKKELQREFAREGQQASQDAAPSDPELADASTSLLADSLALSGQTSGGPASLFSQVRGAAGGGAIPDYGPQLVSLIEAVIAPGFWDTNGGPGTIFYYQPLRVLVIRATSEVHHEIGGTLGALRGGR